jgi:uncharacterized protein YecT (DUF1311 family)
MRSSIGWRGAAGGRQNGLEPDRPSARLTAMRLSQFLFVLALVASGSLPARAETPDAKDVATITKCLEAPTKGPTGQEVEEARCLLKIAAPCIGDDLGVADRMQINCYDRERLVWDKLVNDSYRIMVNGLESEQVKKLREMQRAWIHVRDLTCGFWYDYFQGTMANLMIASCQNRETARRAIYLRSFSVDIAQRK